MVLTTNKRVGCEPFANRNVKSQVVSKGVLGITQKLELTKLKGLVGDDEGVYVPGSFVYVRGESVKDLWSTPMSLEGVQVILVPFEAIVAKYKQRDMGCDKRGQDTTWEGKCGCGHYFATFPITGICPKCGANA